MKKISLLFLCILLVFSFVSCDTPNNETPSEVLTEKMYMGHNTKLTIFPCFILYSDGTFLFVPNATSSSSSGLRKFGTYRIDGENIITTFDESSFVEGEEPITLSLTLQQDGNIVLHVSESSGLNYDSDTGDIILQFKSESVVEDE